MNVSAFRILAFNGYRDQQSDETNRWLTRSSPSLLPTVDLDRIVKEDEWILITVGAVLGFVVGELQVQIMI